MNIYSRVRVGSHKEPYRCNCIPPPFSLGLSWVGIPREFGIRTERGYPHVTHHLRSSGEFIGWRPGSLFLWILIADSWSQVATGRENSCWVPSQGFSRPCQISPIPALSSVTQACVLAVDFSIQCELTQIGFSNLQPRILNKIKDLCFTDLQG